MRPGSDRPSSPGRWFLHVLIAAIGVMAIVGSGGGSLGFPEYTGPGSPSQPSPPISVRLTVTVTPSVVTVQPGATAVFNASASGAIGSTSYQWSRNSVDIAGANSSSYRLYGATLADDGAQFTVRVTAANGTGTASGVLRVVPLPPIVYEDGEFESSDWIEAVSADPPQEGSTATVSRSTTGGNPGAFRHVQYAMPAGPALLEVQHIALSSTYDPARQGQIDGIDFAVDCTRSAGESRIAPLLEQAGRRFATEERWTCAVTWQAAFALSNQVAQAFVQLEGPTCGTGETCPDFSANGGPIRFGLLTVGRIASGLPAATFVQGIDNWRVTVRRN